MVKVILGSFGAFPIIDNLISRKWLVVERNGVKFGPRGWVFNVHRVLLTLKWLRSFWGHSVHSDFRQPCISKMAGRRAKRSEIWASGCSTAQPSAPRAILQCWWADGMVSKNVKPWCGRENLSGSFSWCYLTETCPVLFSIYIYMKLEKFRSDKFRSSWQELFLTTDSICMWIIFFIPAPYIENKECIIKVWYSSLMILSG